MASTLALHAACLGLCAADYLARALRIELLARSVGHPMGYRHAMAVNTIGDAACALTPLRIGGEPARLGVMLNAGVPATAAFVAISSEVLAAWPVILILAGLLTWRYAPSWWSTAAPVLAQSAGEKWPWMLGILLLTLVGWWVVHRGARATHRHLRRPLQRVLVHWRRLPVAGLLATVPLTIINLTARVAVLPVLAMMLPHPPPIGALLVGSFALLYSQLILPTPSGAGAVDAGFLAGAAGDLGSGVGSLLLFWRFYTSGIGIILGVITGSRLLGWRFVREWLRPRRAVILGPENS